MYVRVLTCSKLLLGNHLPTRMHDVSKLLHVLNLIFKIFNSNKLYYIIEFATVYIINVSYLFV
jgi:hypothetical protein